MPKSYDCFIPVQGPYEYTAIIIPTPENQAPRKSLLEKNDPFPDLNVFLNAKAQGFINDWAKTEFNDILAAHIKKYLRSKDEKEIATLTPKELYRLQGMILKYGVKQKKR